MLTVNGKRINPDCISVTLILVGEICFYTIDSLYLYWMLTGFGMAIGILHNMPRFSFKIAKDNFVVWVCIMYFIYFVYGLFFLQKGEFPWDTIGYRLIEIIALYLAISNIFAKDIAELEKAVIFAGIFSAIYLICVEGANIFVGGQRIGDSLSGNVNTVGYNFGIISTITMWYFCKEKKAYRFILILIFSALMLITGSKKVLIIIIANLAMYFWYQKGKISGWIKTVSILLVGIYIIFNVPYFYDIIGSRVEAMIETMILGSSSPIYSHSTEVRDEMIKEALVLFQNHPILGGGWNYFYSNTVYGYEYSHCNYTEMLCSFGIVGTVIFYGRHFHDLKIALKYKASQLSSEHDFVILIFILTAEALVLDWAAVTFSAQCVWYFSFIFCAAAIRAIRENKKYNS